MPLGSGTTDKDLIGTKEINRNGTVFNLGLLPSHVFSSTVVIFSNAFLAFFSCCKLNLNHSIEVVQFHILRFK